MKMNKRSKPSSNRLLFIRAAYNNHHKAMAGIANIECLKVWIRNCISEVRSLLTYNGIHLNNLVELELEMITFSIQMAWPQEQIPVTTNIGEECLNTAFEDMFRTNFRKILFSIKALMKAMDTEDVNYNAYQSLRGQLESFLIANPLFQLLVNDGSGDSDSSHDSGHDSGH